MQNPTVFISYSHDSEQHKEWVKKLGADLMHHGVNVILDQWDLRIGADLRFFMEQGLNKSTLVLCICSSEYVRKSDLGKGGVGFESMIITSALLENANTDYIVPIIRNNSTNVKTPIALKSKLYIDFSNDQEYFSRYSDLIERIYEEDSKKKPILGDSPYSNKVVQQIELKKRLDSIQYYNSNMNDKVTFRNDNNNGIYVIGTGDYTFSTKWSRAGNNSIHVYGKIGFSPNTIDFPEFDNIVNFDFSSNHRTIKTGQVFVIQNDKGKFVSIKLGNVKSSNHGYAVDELEFDYLIYDNIF
jgi:hypothetical protein